MGEFRWVDGVREKEMDNIVCKTASMYMEGLRNGPYDGQDRYHTS